MGENTAPRAAAMEPYANCARRVIQTERLRKKRKKPDLLQMKGDTG